MTWIYIIHGPWLEWIYNNTLCCCWFDFEEYPHRYLYKPPEWRGYELQRPLCFPYLCGSLHLWTLGVKECRAVGDSQIQAHYLARRRRKTNTMVIWKKKMVWWVLKWQIWLQPTFGVTNPLGLLGTVGDAAPVLTHTVMWQSHVFYLMCQSWLWWSDLLPG